MSVKVDAAEVERAWAAWLVEQNRRGMFVAIVLVAVLHAIFAVVDRLIAPPEHFDILLATRVLGELYTFAMYRALKTEFFARRVIPLTAVYMVLVGFSITVMTLVLGGFHSNYYPGLNLVMMGAGLLFVWPRAAVLATHGTIVLSFLVTNFLFDTTPVDMAAIVPIAFVTSTAMIVSVGQIFGYRREREQVENRLALEHASARLTRAHDELQRLDKFKSRFFANITHELKTPLAMILSPVELMIGGELGSLTEGQRATLKSVYRNGSRLLKLIGDLLDLSRIEESRMRLRIAENDLVAYLRNLVAQVAPLTDRKNIAVTFKPQAETATAWCDLDRLERVFVNLLSNAAKFTPVGGHISVHVESSDTAVTVCVEDDGPGFPSDMAERVFERFFQVDAETAQNRYNQGGTGIGLALARELVELHSGRIWAESSPGKGARFYVELPRDRAHFRSDAIERRKRNQDVPQDRRSDDQALQEWTHHLSARDEFRLLDVAEATERRVVERDVDEGSRGRTVLVVEDTPDVIRVVHLVLRQHFRILAAPDGKRGLEMALRERPNLIISDMMMPEMDGLEMTRRLRADPRTRHVPVVMLTARGDLEDRVHGLESGVNAYLTKPFAARELLTTVKKLLESHDATADLLLSQQMDSLEIVAGGLAHEINNPLNYIKNSLARIRIDAGELIKAAREQPEPPAKLKAIETRTQKMFETAESGIARIADTVALMGRYSREGYSRLARPHDVFQAAQDVVKVVLPATGRRVEVVTNFEGDGKIDCVPEEFHQLLTNLIQNAIEASPDDGTGRVEVTGKGEDTSLTLTVSDNGPGIKPDNHAQIFTPFFTTKEPGAGMGLGLTIAWRVAQSLGGTLTEQGTYGKGATFVARFPRRPRKEAPTPAVTASATPSSPPQPLAASPKADKAPRSLPPPP